MQVKATFNEGCRCGNQMYLYAAGRLLARKLGHGFQSPPIDGFSRTKRLILGDSYQRSGIGEPYELLEGADPLPQWPNVQHLHNKNVEVARGFLNSRYFDHDVRSIRDWFEPDAPRIRVDDEDLLVNVRVGNDFINYGLVLHPDYYHYVLERVKFRRLYLMCDVFDHPYLNMLKKYNPIQIPGYGVEHFAAALNFRKIVMSNSTFCWWFTFCSRANEIYMPMLQGARCGSWCQGHLKAGIDLRWNRSGITTVYNVTNWTNPPVPMTDAELEEAQTFAKPSHWLNMESK